MFENQKIGDVKIFKSCKYFFSFKLENSDFMGNVNIEKYYRIFYLR